ncbi:(Fe-S)-binding protein [Spirochaetota bacterium]
MISREYTDFLISTPKCNPESSDWAVRFTLVTDVSNLFPYINSAMDSSKYFDNPHYVKFTVQEKTCVLYPKQVLLKPFKNREEAVEFIESFFDFLIDLENRKDSITPDTTKHKSISVLEVYKHLPKTNCGECGYQSCMAFANDLIVGKIGTDSCCQLTADFSLIDF